MFAAISKYLLLISFLLGTIMRHSNWRIHVFAAVKKIMNTRTLTSIVLMAAPSHTDTGTLQPALVWTSVNSLQTVNAYTAFLVALVLNRKKNN